MAEPTRQRSAVTDDELARELRALGGALELPRADLAAEVGRRLRSAPERHPRRRHWSSARLAVAAAALVAVLAVGGLLGFSSGTREAVADRLGIGGVAVEPVATIAPTVGGELQLGEEIRLADLASAAGYQPYAPPAVLGAPDGVYLLSHAWGAQVSYVYRPSDDLPEVTDSGVGLLVTQFPGTTDENYVQKQLGPDSTLKLLDLDGAPAFWISGAPHVFYYQDASGQIREETLRLAGNVLVWQVDGLTLRIESTLPRDEVVRIAESLTR